MQPIFGDGADAHLPTLPRSPLVPERSDLRASMNPRQHGDRCPEAQVILDAALAFANVVICALNLALTTASR
jgi:hypothetical protein